MAANAVRRLGLDGRPTQHPLLRVAFLKLLQLLFFARRRGLRALRVKLFAVRPLSLAESTPASTRRARWPPRTRRRTFLLHASPEIRIFECKQRRHHQHHGSEGDGVWRRYHTRQGPERERAHGLRQSREHEAVKGHQACAQSPAAAWERQAPPSSECGPCWRRAIWDPLPAGRPASHPLPPWPAACRTRR